MEKQRIDKVNMHKCGCGKFEFHGNIALKECLYCIECKEALHTQYNIIKHYDHKVIPINVIKED
jgi:hypothetical protein